jgi:hypothetical protein
MSGPNLSQYFANDPPSMFDEISANNMVNGEFIVFICFFINSKNSAHKLIV